MNRRIHYFIYTLFVFSGSFSAFAQTAYLNKAAGKAYAQQSYGLAADLYGKALMQKDSNGTALANLADCYRRLNRMKEAEQIYTLLFNSTPEPEQINYQRYAQVLAVNGKYPSSALWYDKYARATGDKNAAAFVRAYKDLSHFYADSSRYKVDFVSINSYQTDYAPAYYKSGLVFISGRKAGVGVKRVHERDYTAYTNLYYVSDTGSIHPEAPYTYNEKSKKYRLNDDETPPTSNDANNTGYYASYFRDSTLYEKSGSTTDAVLFDGKLNTRLHMGPVCFSVTQDTVFFTRNNDGLGSARKSDSGYTHLNIFYSVHKDGAWGKVMPMPFNNNEYSTADPALSADGRTMVFASNRPGGFGGVDLYKSEWKEGNWSTPVNLGPDVNTPGNELFPFIAGDNTLYLASDGIPGLGGYDIFKATNENGLYTKMSNLGYPVNSAADDFGIATNADGTRGFFSSNRKRLGLDDDIYSFTFTRPKGIVLAGYVRHKTSGRPLSYASVDITTQRKKSGHMVTNNTGFFTFSDIHIGDSLTITGSKERFEPNTIFETTNGMQDGDTKYVVIYLDTISITLVGTVYGMDDKKPIKGVTLQLTEECTQTLTESTTDETGSYLFPLKPNCCYVLATHKIKCGKTSIRATTADPKINTIIRGDIGIFCEGDIIRIDNILYDLDKSDIRPDAALELDKLVAILQRYPTMTVELRSHTDCRAPAAYNMKLSDRRAKSAAAYVRSKGISTSRITGKGYGESLLLNDCACEGQKIKRNCSEEEHQLNRRTEFVVLHLEAPPLSNLVVHIDSCDEKAIFVRGHVLNETTGEPIADAEIKLVSKIDGSTIMTRTDINGAYEIKAVRGKDYTITASKKGIPSGKSKDFVSTSEKLLSIDITLTPKKKE